MPDPYENVLLGSIKYSVGFCWIFFPTGYSIGYSVGHQGANRIFHWTFYSIYWFSSNSFSTYDT